jgi:hypothetical protein
MTPHDNGDNRFLMAALRYLHRNVLILLNKKNTIVIFMPFDDPVSTGNSPCCRGTAFG